MNDINTFRQRVIDAIETRAGNLLSVPYDKITTKDLVKILYAIDNRTPLYFEFINEYL